MCCAYYLGLCLGISFEANDLVADVVEVVGSLPPIDTIAATSQGLQVLNPVEVSPFDRQTSSNQACNSTSGYASLPNTSSEVANDHSKIATPLAGAWVSDENGAIRTLLIDGAKYYLLKCVDASNTATYSLVAANRDE